MSKNDFGGNGSTAWGTAANSLTNAAAGCEEPHAPG